MDKDRSVKIEIDGYFLKQDRKDIEEKLAHLILEGIIFCNNGWWYEEEGKFWPKDYITLHVNCNDVFAWGCADSEDITHNEVNELYEMWIKDPGLGASAWCIKKRKQMPQPPVEELFKKDNIWNLKELIK